MKALRAVSLSALALIALVDLARADVVGEPPASCPVHGTQPATCHGGPYCGLVDCGHCAADEVCQTVALCAEDIQCAGDVNPADLPKYLRANVLGVCDAKRACAAGTCRDLQICAPKTTGATPTSPSQGAKKSGCAGGGPGPVGLAGVVATLALWAATRRQ